MIPVNEAQQSLQDLIDSVSQSHQPIVIAGKNSNAVLLSEADWAAVQETLYLLSIPEMRESIREGLATPIEECDRQLEWQVRNQLKPNQLSNIQYCFIYEVNMTTYQEVRRQVENLTPDQQLQLLEDLAVMLRHRMIAKPKRNIMELEGLGKETWQGLDAQEYVNQERASWNG